MALGFRSEGGRGMKRSVITMTPEDSVAEFKRERSSVRPYVRSSTQKLRWTHGLHQSFMRAVIKLGGKDKATPKRILQHMDKDGITIAHIKSHLQMYRTGKINEEGLPNSGSFSFDPNPKQPSLELSAKEARDVHLALQLLKEGRISGAAGTETLLISLAEIQACKRFKEDVKKTTHEFVPVVDIRASKRFEKEDVKKTTHEFVPEMEELSAESRPNSWSAPRYESFLDDDANNESVEASGKKRKFQEEEIELDLTMATRSSSNMSPRRIQFPRPSTPEEATLSLGLSS